jgi:hypothetical protein
MALYPVTLYGPNFLSNSAAVIYDSDTPTVAGATKLDNVTIIKQIIVCNTDTSARTFTLYLDTNSTAAASETLFNAVSLAVNETKIINTSIVLRADKDQKIMALASVSNKVTITLVGLEEYA